MTNEPDLTEVFEYLDELRESGETNMFGAGAYLERDFGVDRKTASKLAAQWMESFNLTDSAAMRAAQFKEEE